MFYAAIPVMVWLVGKLGRARTLATLYLLAAVYVLATNWLATRTGTELYLLLQRQLPGQLGFFLAGAAGYYYAEALRQRWKWVVPAALAALVTAYASYHLKVLLFPAALATIVVYVAVGMRHFGNFGNFGNFGKYGDLSYSIYIFHFPVIQWLVSVNVYRESPFGALAVTIAIVLALAFASWHLVEKPFLRKSSHYIIAERLPT
jgi:peptidoglycan/LPS O-acetylase OafA/YrhL